jgi:hypothetical protein
MKIVLFLLVILPGIFLTLEGCSSREHTSKRISGDTYKNDYEDYINKYLSTRNDSSFFALLDLDFYGMEEVKRYVVTKDWENAKNAYLKFRREKIKTKWNVDPVDKPDVPNSDVYPQADLVMKNIIGPSMGAPQVYLGEKINWDFNPVDPSEPHFTNEWTWQNLNRMRSWNTLGSAYWYTLDEKYAKKWIELMVDWVRSNPVPLGADHNETLTWRTIEAGIRMNGSWMNSYFYFLNSPSFDPEAHITFVKGVIEHGLRLQKITLDYPTRRTNWVTMECNGLGTIGILFPELKLAESFRSVAFNKMSMELDSQVYPDGAQIELSPGYHQTSRSNFMRLARLAQMNNVSLPDGYINKLKKMYEFNLYMMDPSGHLPPFNDSGPVNAVPSLREAFEIWGDKKFLFGATLGKEGERPEFDSYYFNWAGYYVMRSGWDVLDNCLYFDAGPVGYGHEHEDMLNLYLYSRGKILLTEAGNYSYDLSKWRRYALSTASHNTIIVDGKEQHRRSIYSSRLIKEPLDNPWVTSPLFDYGRGTYSSGYQTNKYKAVPYRPREYVGERNTSINHTRHVIFLKPHYYLAIDFLQGEGEHQYDAHFHLDAPDARIIESKAVHTLRKDDVQLGLYPMDISNMEVKIIKGQKDPLLGWIPREKRAIPTVVFSKKEKAPSTFSTLLYPYTTIRPDVDFANIMEDEVNFWGKQISTPHETVAVLVNRTAEQSNTRIFSSIVPEFTTDAQVIVIRNPKDKDANYFGFSGISEYRGGNLIFKLRFRASILKVEDDEDQLLFYNPGDEDIYISISNPVEGAYILPVKKWMKLDATGLREVPKFAIPF